MIGGLGRIASGRTMRMVPGEESITPGAKAPFFAGFAMPRLKPRPTLDSAHLEA